MRCEKRPQEWGANAVIDVQVRTEQVYQGVSEVLAYGTAVVIE